MDRGDIANRASTSAQHVLGHALGKKKTGSYIHLVKAVKLLGSDFAERAVEGDAGVVDQAVDSPEKRSCVLGEFIELPQVGKIALKCTGPCPQGLQLSDSRIGSDRTLRIM